MTSSLFNDVNSALETEKANVRSLSDKMKNLTTVYVSTGQGTSNHAQRIQEYWTSFPDDMPFIGLMIDNNKVFVLGYMYGSRQYGCVMYLSYASGAQGMVLCREGNFTVKEL